MNISFGRFAQYILGWSDDHPRPMPWKETQDPYRIWISEIILQQTQVAQGMPFYKAFVRRFPTIQHLARASENEVLRLWQGLGYNARARNLHAAARAIVQEYDGVFPHTYETIRALKGVGEYTAAAIASFAYGLPIPVLESNVMRVLCRVFGIAEDPAKRQTRERFLAMLGKMIRNAEPAQFNQAIMNFGALQCTPRKPECKTCVLSKYCMAYRDGLVETLPIRKNKVSKKERYFHYFVIRDKHGVILHQRTAKDIWQQMYEFPLLETSKSQIPTHTAREKYLSKLGAQAPQQLHCVQRFSQTLTHQEIHCTFYEIPAKNISRRKLPGDHQYAYLENLQTFAFPKVIRTFLSDNSLLLIKLPQGSKT